MTTTADLRRLAEQATPGPWRVRENGDVETADGEYVAVDREGLLPAVREEADAAYIAAANPQAILALLDERDHWHQQFIVNRDLAAAAERRVAVLEEDPNAPPCTVCGAYVDDPEARESCAPSSEASDE